MEIKVNEHDHCIGHVAGEGTVLQLQVWAGRGGTEHAQTEMVRVPERAVGGAAGAHARKNQLDVRASVRKLRPDDR